MSKTIFLQFNNFPILFHNDGYLNATKAAKAFDKKPHDYLRLDSTKEYIKELEKALRENLATKKTPLTLVNIVQGGAEEQGTWLHPQLAVHYARWLSIKFAVWCDIKIQQIIADEQPALATPEATPKTNSKEQVLQKENSVLKDELLALYRFKIETLEKPKKARAKRKPPIPLTDKVKEEILRLKAQGYSQSKIALMISRSTSTVSFVINNYQSKL